MNSKKRCILNGAAKGLGIGICYILLVIFNGPGLTSFGEVVYTLPCMLTMLLCLVGLVPMIPMSIILSLSIFDQFSTYLDKYNDPLIYSMAMVGWIIWGVLFGWIKYRRTLKKQAMPDP